MNDSKPDNGEPDFMRSYFDIPLDRRIWNLDRMCGLREGLSHPQCEALLFKLESITWAEWNRWLLPNLSKVAQYGDDSASERKKAWKGLGEDALLIHHAAMFLTGLLYAAKNDCFPHEFIHRNDQFNYDSLAMAASIKAWDNIELHYDCSLYWQFDDPYPESPLPFKRDTA